MKSGLASSRLRRVLAHDQVSDKNNDRKRISRRNDTLDNKLKQAAFASSLILMRPIVRILLRCGVTWKELADLVRLLYVDVATEDYGKHGRPANASPAQEFARPTCINVQVGFS